MAQKLGRTNWDTDCRAISLDKRNNISAARPGFAAQLYGWDGTLQGGLRPHPGFKQIRTVGAVGPANAVTTVGASVIPYATFTASTKVLARGAGTLTGAIAAGSLIEVTAATETTVNKGIYLVRSISGDDMTLHRQLTDDGTNLTNVAWTRVTLSALASVTEVYDFRPFSLQIKGNVAVRGFVVRAKGTISDPAVRYQTWVEWYDPIAATWRSSVLEQSTGTTAYGSLDATRCQLDIAVWGRLMYVFRQGWEPILVTATASSTAVALSVNLDTGPGAQPVFKRRGDSALVGSYNESYLHELSSSTVEGSTSTTSSPTAAAFRSTYMLPSTLGTTATTGGGAGPYPGVDSTTPKGSADGSGRWFTTSFVPPALVSGGTTGTSAGDITTRFAWWDGLVNNVTNTAVGLKRGNYAFAYQLYDETTGRKSALSQVVSQPYERFGSDTHSHFVWDIVYDSTKWTHAILYRSANSDSAGGTFVNSLLFSEAVIRLSDYKPDSTTADTSGDPTPDLVVGWDGTKGSIYNTTPTTIGTYTGTDMGSPYLRAIFWNILEDKELAFQNLYNNDAYFDEDMPTAGCAAVYENTLVCSRNRDGSKGSTGVGEIRYSSLTEKSLELFPGDNRWVPKTGSDSPWQFIQLGDRMIGFAPNRQYMVYKAGSYMAVREMHEGFGSANARAGCIVGNVAYVATTKGLVSVDVTGALEGVRSLDYVFLNEWRSYLSGVQLAFDAKTACLYVMRPPIANSYTDHGEMCCLWQTTSMVTQLIHTKFVKAGEGVEPGSSDDASRALFITNSGKVHRVDDSRSKTASPSMLGDSSLVVTDLNLTVTLSGYTPTYSAPGMTFKVTCATSFTLSSDMVGWVLAFTGGTLNGQAYEITAIDNSAKTITVSTNSNLTASLATGDGVCINPILCRVVSPPLGLQNEDGVTFGPQNLFRRRRVTAIGAHVVGVGGTTNNVNAKWRGVVYHSVDASSLVKTPPTKVDESEYTSIVEKPASNYAKIQRAGTLLAPGIEVYAAGMDFTLLGFRAVGSIESSEREGFAE